MNDSLQKYLKSFCSWVLLLTILSLFAGCSTAPVRHGELIEPVYPADRLIKDDVETLDVYDPWEGMNRSIYSFNYYFDRYVFLPVVDGYAFITPDIVEDGITNFLFNLAEINNLLNSVLQLKGKATTTTAGRFLINSTIGILGIFDPATSMKMYRVNEDFGQTLGYYGLGPGPYLVLPVLGPSSLRDTTGLVVDSVVYSLFTGEIVDELKMSSSEEDRLNYILAAMRAIDTRYRTEFRYYATGSPFEYELVRLLYNTKRELDIEK
jgi:phospholipid-binding lipoprotein MlaA